MKRTYSYLACYLAFINVTVAATKKEIEMLISADDQNVRALVRLMNEEQLHLRVPRIERVHWSMREATESNAFSDVLPVKIRGRCDAQSLAPWPHSPSPLAWVFQTDGTILSSAIVDCAAVGMAIAQELFQQPRSIRQRLLARAIVRVATHELMHVLRNSAEHDRTGLGRASLSARDLIDPMDNTIMARLAIQ